MFKRLASGQETVLAYDVEGTISEESFDQLLGEVRSAVDRYGGVRLLVRVQGWPTSGTPTVGERLRFAKEHQPGIERYAVVGNDRVIGFLTSVADAFVDMDLRFFELDREEAAWAWVGGSGVAEEDPG